MKTNANRKHTVQSTLTANQAFQKEKAQCFGNKARVFVMIQKKKKNKCQQNKEYRFIMETHVVESPKKKKQEKLENVFKEITNFSI